MVAQMFPRYLVTLDKICLNAKNKCEGAEECVKQIARRIFKDDNLDYDNLDYDKMLADMEAGLDEAVQQQLQPTVQEEEQKLSWLRYRRVPDSFAELPASDDEVFRDVPGWTPGYRARKRFGFSKPQGGFSVFGQTMGRGHGGSNCPQ